MRLKNIWRILLILLIFRLSANAAENRTEIKVDFRANVSHIEPDFSDNALRINEIVTYLRNLHRDSSTTITSVTLCGTASPEGSYNYNRHLAGARLAALEKLIRSEVSIPDSIITFDDTYIPWDYLRSQLLDSDLTYRDSVISIIDMAPRLVKDPDNGRLVDHRIVKLKRLDNRRVWNQLFRLYFGKMRNAIAVIITYKEDKVPIDDTPPAIPPEPLLTEQSVDHTETDTIPDKLISATTPETTPLTEPRQPGSHRPIHIAIRTNMLYDVMAIPNIGVEFYLGRNWSVQANWMYSWWSCDRRHRYWRAYGGDINVNRWFGKAAGGCPLTGHHAGVYAQMLTYDFEFGGVGYQGGKWTWGAGISYGYSLPVGRHINIDFTVGFGYARGEYKKYHPADGCYVWDSTHRLNWFGPTKAEVALVWLIGSRPGRKGGVR